MSDDGATTEPVFTHVAGGTAQTCALTTQPSSLAQRPGALHGLAPAT